MKVCILQQSAGTPPGAVIEWLNSENVPYRLVRLDLGEQVPHVNEVDWLIALGGPMNVDDERDFPFLTQEKVLIKEMLERRRAILGICLGGQLLAQALGAKVTKHSHWEVGWHAVEITGFGRLTVFQWHQDTFAIPDGATQLATNSICFNQAFKYGQNVIGLQFHPEASKEWIKSCAYEKDYPVGKFVQTPNQVLEGVRHLRDMNAWLFRTLDEMYETVRATQAA